MRQSSALAVTALLLLARAGAFQPLLRSQRIGCQGSSLSVFEQDDVSHKESFLKSCTQAPHNSSERDDGRKIRVFSKIRIASAVASLALPLALVFTQLAVEPASAASYGSLTEEQKMVAEAWRLVDNSFLDRTFNGQDWFQTRQNLVKKKYKNMQEAQDVVDGMMKTLGDKFSRYLSPSQLQSTIDAAQGNVVGVGVELAVNKQSRVIASDVEPSSPASSAGIKPNDVFVEVDGTKFDTTSTPDDVAMKLRGPPGSKVGMVVERDEKTLDFIIARAPIKITTVRSYMTNAPGVGKVGVIRIKSFSGTTAETVKEKYQELAKKGASAFVFDIRANPGGLLPGGVETASLFLPKGTPVVFVVNKSGVVDTQNTLADGVDLSSPLVVLVDSNTASAAEVFTAALQENSRATVVGEKTFGKGIIQTIRTLSNERGGVAITVARYETPKHNSINKAGISVDIPSNVDCPKGDASACLPVKAFKNPT